jgi:hypothetical protein
MLRWGPCSGGGGLLIRSPSPVRQLTDAGVSPSARTAALWGSWLGTIICDTHEINAYSGVGLGRGFLSANARLAIRVLARENSVAKQDPALLRQF